jgi:hypothetical protein
VLGTGEGIPVRRDNAWATGSSGWNVSSWGPVAFVPVSTEGNTTKCDACGRERLMTGTPAPEIAVLPDSVKHTYEKLGIPEAERTCRPGETAQATASKAGWQSVGENDYCPDCA